MALKGEARGSAGRTSEQDIDFRNFWLNDARPNVTLSKSEDVQHVLLRDACLNPQEKRLAPMADQQQIHAGRDW